MNIKFTLRSLPSGTHHEVILIFSLNSTEFPILLFSFPLKERTRQIERIYKEFNVK